MHDPKRPTRPSVELTDIDDDMPTTGSLVLALSIGGRLLETVWTKDSHKFFKAWMPYPDVPPAIKKKLYEHYIGVRK